jgi:RNA polymerase sigma factor (sigma-70 family)
MFQCDCPPDDCAGRVALYLAGEGTAGNELARKFAPLVHSIVRKVLREARREEWEDAAQAIFLRVFANLHTWEHRCPFCKWLALVAGRRAIDMSKIGPALERVPLEDVADPRPPTSEGDLTERLEVVLRRFPPEWRQLWDWFAQGVPREEMARRAGKSLRTIQYRLAEILDQIREQLGPAEG